MIDRQLRPIGEAIRFVWPSFSERKFKFCNFILKNFGRGADVTPWKIKCEQIKIPRADGSELRLCVYSPRKREGEMPGLLWIHGGGYAWAYPSRITASCARLSAQQAASWSCRTTKNRSMPLSRCARGLLSRSALAQGERRKIRHETGQDICRRQQRGRRDDRGAHALRP